MKKIIYLIGFFILLIPCLLYAQAENASKLWLTNTTIGDFGKHHRGLYNLNLQMRFQDEKSWFERAIIRPSLGYMITRQWSAWLGYDFMPFTPRPLRKVHYNNTIWEQLRWQNRFEHIQVASNSRFEQRWVNTQPTTSLRWRQRFELAIQPTSDSKIVPDFFDEIFILLNHPSWTPNNLIGQNRFYAGIEYLYSKHTKFEIGYLNIYYPRRGKERIDNVLVLGLTFNFRADPSLVEQFL